MRAVGETDKPLAADKQAAMRRTDIPKRHLVNGPAGGHRHRNKSDMWLVIGCRLPVRG